MTDAERKLWFHLRRSPPEGTHFRRRATIGPYFADFACHQTRLVIELDGGQHASEATAAYDAKRTSYLAEQGYRVIRFWNNEVLSDLNSVMLAVHAAISDAAAAVPPTPNPSPPFATLPGGGEQKGHAGVVS